MKFIKKNYKKLLIVLISALILPICNLHADTNTPISSGNNGMILNPIPSVTSVPGLISTILKGVLTIGIPIVALAIIYCGFLFVFARGNSEKLTKAKEALMYTLIGAAILLGAWAIATMIQSTVMGLTG